MKSRISICIPTFNRSQLFEKTLRSAIFQTKKPYEIIVVDNHSTDETPDVIKKYKKYNIKYYRHKKNIGFVENWNKCIEYATGDYLCILHADDLITKDWYEKWEKIIQKNADVDCFFSAWSFIDLDDKVTSVYRPFTKSRKFSKGHVIKEFYSKNFFSPAVSGDMILRKSLFEKNKLGKFQLHLETETDIAMYFPLMAHYSLYYYDKVLFGYRIHPYQTIVKKVEKITAQRLLSAARRYVSFLSTFYTADLVPTIGKYDIFYKKLLITYQFRSIFRSIKLKQNLFTPTIRIMNQKFSNFPTPWDFPLYIALFYEFAKRFFYGKYLAEKYKNLFASN